MAESSLYSNWKSHLANAGELPLERLKYCYEIVDNLIKSYQIPGDKGIFLEHKKIEQVINGSIQINNEEKSCLRYAETAYLIWTLSEMNRLDILSNNIKNWGSGVDELGNSHFRNFEFECHTALRFLEAGFEVVPINDQSKPEFCINNKFVIECKRPSKKEGLFYNTLKARKQIDNARKEGILIFSLDDLEGFTSPLEEQLIFPELKKLSLLSELGLGVSKSYLTGVIFEYLDIYKATKGSFLYAIGNDIAHIDKEVALMASIGICGHEKLVFDKNILNISDRYPLDYSKTEKEKMRLALKGYTY